MATKEAARISKRVVSKRVGLVRAARISLVAAQRVQELAIAPLGEGVRISLVASQARSRAVGAAKRKLAAAIGIADADEQPRAASRGARLAGLAIAAARSKL